MTHTPTAPPITSPPSKNMYAPRARGLGDGHGRPVRLHVRVVAARAVGTVGAVFVFESGRGLMRSHGQVCPVAVPHADADTTPHQPCQPNPIPTHPSSEYLQGLRASWPRYSRTRFRFRTGSVTRRGLGITKGENCFWGCVDR